MTDLMWLSTRQLAALMAEGEVSSEDAVRAHYACIDEVNPTINAISSPWTGASHAEAAVQRRPTSHRSPPTVGSRWRGRCPKVGS